jgi:hypothetical protein
MSSVRYGIRLGDLKNKHQTNHGKKQVLLGEVSPPFLGVLKSGYKQEYGSEKMRDFGTPHHQIKRAPPQKSPTGAGMEAGLLNKRQHQRCEIWSAAPAHLGADSFNPRAGCAPVL